MSSRRRSRQGGTSEQGIVGAGDFRRSLKQKYHVSGHPISRGHSLVRAGSEIVAAKAEQVNGHLAGDELDDSLLHQTVQYFNAGDAVALDGLLHEPRGRGFETGNAGLDQLGHVPVDALERARAKRRLHRHSGIAERTHLEKKSGLPQQIQAAESEEDRNVPAQRSSRGAQDEGRVGSI